MCLEKKTCYSWFETKQYVYWKKKLATVDLKQNSMCLEKIKKIATVDLKQNSMCLEKKNLLQLIWNKTACKCLEKIDCITRNNLKGFWIHTVMSTIDIYALKAIA